MKTIRFLLLAIAALTISAIFYACDSDETTPISLKDSDETTLKFYYPNDTKYSFPLKGGDGNYSVKSTNNEVIKIEMISAIDFSAEIIGLGKTQITITDKSQNSLTLDVVVDYWSLSFTVSKHEIFISGDDLTENEKKAISEEYLTEIPVKVGGGYKFIFTDLLQTEGEVLIYTDKFGNNAIETTFEKRIFDNYTVYEIVINDVKRSFIFTKYISPAKSEPYVPLAFWEDITPIVKAKYHKTEQVIVEQEIELSVN